MNGYFMSYIQYICGDSFTEYLPNGDTQNIQGCYGVFEQSFAWQWYFVICYSYHEVELWKLYPLNPRKSLCLIPSISTFFRQSAINRVAT